jgi:hypothetical protein
METIDVNFLRVPLKPTAVCLGLALTTRDLGLAVTSPNQLFATRVINLRKLVSDEARERRFAQVLDQALATYPVTRLAVVLPERPSPPPPRVATQHTRLVEVSRERALPLTTKTAQDVKTAFTDQDAPHASHRTLTAALVARFPELAAKAPHLAPPAPGFRPRRLRTNKERYWSRMFLALGGALHALETASPPAYAQED